MAPDSTGHTVEFKKQLVEAHQEQRDKKTSSRVIREHGVGTETLRNWVKKDLVDNRRPSRR